MDAFLSILPKLVGARIVFAIFVVICAAYWLVIYFLPKWLGLGKSYVIKNSH